MSSLPNNTGPRLAARALIVENERLLMVNAYPGGTSDLWCAPGGGVEKHQSIPDNLKREVLKETGTDHRGWRAGRHQ
jgi:8-oxo-dGTP diphosphatase